MGPHHQKIFSISTTYHHIVGKDHDKEDHTRRKDFKCIWIATVPNKIKIFLWILYHGRIKINHSLQSKEISILSKCHICNHPKKDIIHLLFQCNTTKFFWDKVHRRNPIPCVPDGSSLTACSWMNWSIMHKVVNHTSLRHVAALLPMAHLVNTESECL